MTTYKVPPYAEALLKAARRDPKVVLVSQDMGSAGGFATEFPRRSFDVGISEQNLVGVAAGLAHVGKNPFVLAMAPFITMRSFEQIRDDCAYNENSVKFLALFTGLEAGAWGVTHHALEDLALMRAIPGMTVIAPADSLEAGRAVEAVASLDGPAYVRLAGFAADVSPIDELPADFAIGSATVLRDGADCTLIATGSLVRTALAAADALATDGIEAGVINMHTVKPLDTDAVARAVDARGLIVTVEEHSIVGGLGAAVAETMAELGQGRLRRVGVPDVFCTEVEPYAELIARYGLDAAGVERAARELVAAG